MQGIDQTLDSREVAEMIEKEHSKLLRDIYRYEEQFAEANIGLGDFFRKSCYKDANNQNRPCYRITKKGCEFIAHKLTGTKGTIFTARYINRFHEMQDMLLNQEPKLPWFIRNFRGKYIMLFRDFESITGVSLDPKKAFWKTYHGIMNSGHCWNGWGWHTVINKEEFKAEYGFEYGDNVCMYYLYPCGIIKALEICKSDKKLNMNHEAYDMIMGGVNIIKKLETKKKEFMTVNSRPLIHNQKIAQTEKHQVQPIQITITLNDSIRNNV